MRLTKRQEALLKFVKAHPNKSTHELARLAGHRQAYETNLRDRLYTLEAKGLVKSTIKKGAKGYVSKRTWKAR